MSYGDLVSLARVKSHLSIATNSSDQILSSMISQISALMRARISRSQLLPSSDEEIYDGTGRDFIQLRNWPVISVSSVLIGTTSIPASAGGSYGWILERGDSKPPGSVQRLVLRGAVFPRDRQNVTVSYKYGYRISDETRTVPVDGIVLVTAPLGPWGSDDGVTIGGVVQVPVVDYTVEDGGRYTLIGKTGETVKISYGYTPHDLELAALEWVSERFRYRDRIGQRSKSLGGAETVSFDNSAVPEFARTVLQNYSRIVSV